MFEMLGLHDDALIQYDELDALFTQFVLNHASGGMILMSILEVFIFIRVKCTHSCFCIYV